MENSSKFSIIPKMKSNVKVSWVDIWQKYIIGIFSEAHSGSTSNLQKAFHLFSNRPDQYYQIPSDIRNDSEKSDEYLAKIWKEVAKNITNNNEVNESVIIDITGGFNI